MDQEESYEMSMIKGRLKTFQEMREKMDSLPWQKIENSIELLELSQAMLINAISEPHKLGISSPEMIGDYLDRVTSELDIWRKHLQECLEEIVEENEIPRELDKPFGESQVSFLPHSSSVTKFRTVPRIPVEGNGIPQESNPDDFLPFSALLREKLHTVPKIPVNPPSPILISAGFSSIPRIPTGLPSYSALVEAESRLLPTVPILKEENPTNLDLTGNKTN